MNVHRRNYTHLANNDRRNFVFRRFYSVTILFVTLFVRFYLVEKVHKLYYKVVKPTSQILLQLSKFSLKISISILSSKDGKILEFVDTVFNRRLTES